MDIRPLLSSKNHYRPPQDKQWTGRNSNTNLPEYWHEIIDLHHFEEVFLNTIPKSKYPHVGLVGYACDEGIKRNLGRLGAKKGPKRIKERLGKLAYHSSNTVADFGDVRCKEDDLATCQQLFSEVISSLLHHNVFPIALGGGHDIAYAHYKGIKKKFEKQKIGIINFDAHFDLRPLSGTKGTSGTSGTPFYQILSEYPNPPLSYYVVGIQKNANPQSLFKLADQNDCMYSYQSDCQADNMSSIKESVLSFIEKNDSIYLTIDMDCFSSAYASGVSAPSPIGLMPDFVFELITQILHTKKVVACDIAEYNPRYDQDNATANLAARLVDYIVMNLPIS